MRILMLALLVVGTAMAQTVAPQPVNFNTTVQMQPGAFPTALTCLVGFASTCKYVLPGTSDPNHDPYVCNADITASGQTVTLQDANGVTWISGTLGTGGSPVTWMPPPGCRWFPGGLYIQAQNLPGS